MKLKLNSMTMTLKEKKKINEPLAKNKKATMTPSFTGIQYFPH